jgi:redox-sensitive bicupin YhaK (pirin superfamily)
LAHHDHWFDPRDPLREPFKAFGKTLGLPYVDVEGFKMHPHRGFDIWTYVLDGSDGFRHRDSLGDASNNDSDSNSKLSSGSTSRTYRGGTAQWMRTGAGVLHEEYWETKPDKRTNIELFQLWVNLPATHKFDPPAIRYLGKDATAASHQWLQHDIIDDSNNKDGRVVGTVRNLGATLERAITSASPDNKSTMDDTDENAAKDAKDAIGDARERPPVQIMHATISDPGGRWTVEAPLDHSALIYVRKGSANLRGVAGDQVLAKAQQTATFGHNGGTITIENAATSASHQPLDILLLMAMPLRESVVQAGPIVMNSAAEVNDAYQQLDDGTFLDRDHVLRQQKVRLRNIRYG